jgi:hypothetical protein
MIAESRNNPESTSKARPSLQVVLHCEDYEHNDGLLITDSYDDVESEKN